MNQKSVQKYPYSFLVYYALSFATFAIFSTFLSVYLDDIHYTQAQIGKILSVGSVVTLVSQPVWGVASDRAKYKNSVLQLLTFVSAVSVFLFYVRTDFYYTLAVMAFFSFFQMSVPPLGDAITLEHLERTRWKFGPIRLVGTLGFGISAIVAGMFVGEKTDPIFLLYFIISMGALFVSFTLPKVQGHQSEKNKVPLWKLFHSKELILLMLFSLVISITMNFYGAFFPLFYKEIGADNQMVSWAIFIATFSEIPFLLFANRILQKLGTKTTLVASAAITALRWFLLFMATDPYVVLGLQLIHGFTFIVFSYSLATYINENVRKELRSSGQTMNALVMMSLSRIIGTLIGGYLSDLLGNRELFFYNFLLSLAITVLFVFIFAKKPRQKKLF